MSRSHLGQSVRVPGGHLKFYLVFYAGSTYTTLFWVEMDSPPRKFQHARSLQLRGRFFWRKTKLNKDTRLSE
jgi:hypothetical protein